MELLLRLSKGLPREITSEVFFRLHPPTLDEFFEACKSGKILLVEQWFFHDLINNLSIEIDPFFRSRNLTSALYWAVRNGHTEIVSIFLTSGMNMSTETFYAACNNNHPQIIALIIEYRRPPQYNIDLALCWAAYYGHMEAMKVLINTGADVTCALKAAVRNHQSEAVSLLLEHGAIPTEEEH